MEPQATGFAEELIAAFDTENIFRKNRLTADDWQRQLLAAEDDAYLVCCSRRSGKSVTVAGLVSQFALTRQGSTIILAAPSQRQVNELIRTVKTLVRGAGYGGLIVNESVGSVELRGGSRILGVPGGSASTVRGFGADILAVDEACFVGDELLTALTPTIATTVGSKLILLSTPGPCAGYFYKNWIDPDSDFTKIKITAPECKRIPKKFLEKERKDHGDLFFRREYMCEFVQDEARLFDPALIRSRFVEVAGVFG